MKKAITQTIIVFVAINLITAGFTFAQEVPEESPALPIEADVAQKTAQIAERQMQAAQKQIEAAKNELRRMPPSTSATLSSLLSRMGWQYGRSSSVLVIPAAELKVEDLAAITEDMTVMSRIFDKKLSQGRLITGGSWSVGTNPLSFGRDNSAIEAIYLEGYGALFLMKVNVLLSAPPEAKEDKKTKEEDTDPLWTETIQEMYAPLANTRRTRDRPEEKYDAEKVEDLKETLIKTLKHAANIRNLKPDESVILTVIGKAGQSAGVTIKAINRRGEYLILDKDKRTTSIVKAPSLSDIGFSSPAVLTIRAKKSDIDAFAKGRLSFDQFRQKILLLSYSYLGGNIGGGPSLSFPTNIVY